MAAAPPSPLPLKAHRDGGDAPVSLFVDTDLGTHLALLVAPDTAIHDLKSQVATEHAAAFPDLGPVAVKSFQVRRKGVLYHLSDSMTLTSAFTKIKGGCFLHVKMGDTDTAAATHCQDTAAINGRRLSDGHLGIHVKKRVQELPVTSSDIAPDMIPQSLEGSDDAALNNVQAHDASPNCILSPSSSQLNTEIKKKNAVGLASDTEAGFDQVIDKAKSYSGQIKHASQTEDAFISSSSMACVGKSSKESNMSHTVDDLHARKEDILHGGRDHDVGLSDKKRVRVEEELLEEIHAEDNVSLEKEHKKSRAGSFDTASKAVLETDITTLGEPLNTSNHREVHGTLHTESIQLENPSTVGKKRKRKMRQLAPSTSASAKERAESSAGAADLSKSTGEVLQHNTLDLERNNVHAMDDFSQEKEHKKSMTGSPDTSSRAVLETDTTLGEPLITSNHHEVLDTLHGQSIQLENPSTVGKKTKKKRRQLAPSKSASAQEMVQTSSGATDLLNSTGDDAHNVELTGRDETVVKASGLPVSSSELNDGNQGDKHVQFVSDAQASTDLISEQEKFEYALKGCRNPSIADDIYSTSEIVDIEGKMAKGNCVPGDGGDKYEEIKQHNEGNHDEGSLETSIVKDGKSTDALDKRQTNKNTSQEKKRKKSKKISSVDMASLDTTGEKEMHEYRENAAKSDTICTEKEIIHEPSMQQMPRNVYQGGSNIIENLSGDGKKKNKRRHNSKSSNGGFVTNESSIECTDAAPIDAKQTTPEIIEGTTVIQQKELGEILDVAATDVIDEVLADIRSKDAVSKDLNGDMLTGQTHLVSNQNTLELPESTVDKLGVTAALPPKYPAVVLSDAPVSSPRHKKSKGRKSRVLSTMTQTNSSHHSNDVPEEDAKRELNESDSLGFADKTNDHKDVLTGDVVMLADNKPKATKRQRKKGPVKQVLGTLDLKEVNAAEANLVQKGSVIDTPLSTVGKAEQKDMSSETLTPKIQETNCSTHGLDGHLAKNSQGEYVTDIIGTHDNENAAGTPTLHVVQKDAMALKSASPNAQKENKKSLNSELQGQDFSLGLGSSADLVNYSVKKDFVNSNTEKGLVSPKISANAHTMVHPSSDEINFLSHFSCSKMNDDPPVSAENKQNNEDKTLMEVKNKKKNKRKQGSGSIEQNNVRESLLTTDTTSLTGHFGISKDIEPPTAAESMNRENENVKHKEKKKRKLKANMEVSVAEKDNPNRYNQGTDFGAQETLISAGQRGKMGQDNGKEGDSKVTQNDDIVHHEPEDSTRNHTLEKILHQSVVDGQNKLLTDKDHVQISKEVRKSTSQTKSHSKTSKPDESIKGGVAPSPRPLRNLVKDFSMSPRASSDSTESAPQFANRFRVAVRKVPKQRSEQTSEKFKKASRKLGPGAIFNDVISEGSEDELDANNEKAAMEASDNSSASADSGISSADSDESEIPDDDDGTVSLSQKSLKEGGLHISSILRGSSSYKKVRRKQMELLDDDTIVPDSQPTDDLWSLT